MSFPGLPDEALAGLDPVTLSVFAVLGLLSVLATTVSLFKLVQFLRLGVGRRARADAALEGWLSGRADAAQADAAQGGGVLARVLEATLTACRARPGDTAWAEELGRQAALREMARMGQGMRILEGVVQAAPMLGLLGTVIGMIDAFGNLAATSGAADPALLARGIWTALTTTAIGLSIAIVFYFVTLWLEMMIESERQAIEVTISAAVHGRVTPGLPSAPAPASPPGPTPGAAAPAAPVGRA